MISHKHKFIFIHIPKTGGNSIQTVLQPFSDDRKTVNDFQDGIHRFSIRGRYTPIKHATLDDYAAALDVSKFKLVACKRHPLDRLLSNYFSPNRWVSRARDGTLNIKSAFWNRELFLKWLIPPAVDYLKVEGVYRPPDFLFSFDSLETDFAAFVQEAEIPAGWTLPVLNAREVASQEVELARADPILAEIGVRHYREDFERFGFPLP